MAEKRPLIVDPGATPAVREMVDTDSIPAVLLGRALAVALTGFEVSSPDVVAATDNLLQAIGKLQAQSSNKVNKDGSKVLSDNNFTNAERVKLANIAEQATENASDAALRDRTTHTGIQAIGTVDGLQVALDAKETPAGALAQIRSYGAGVNAAPYTLNLETHRIGGRFTADAATSTASGLPLPLQHTIDYLPGVNAQTGLMEASALTGNATNGGRKWMRKLNGGVWQSWIEIQTVDGSLLQMQGVGIGATTAPITTTPNSLIAGGAYRMGVAVSAEAGLPLAVGHTVLNLPGDGTNGAHQFLAPITSVTANRDRMWHRQQLSTNWSAPKEFAFLESTFPNLKIGNVASADANTIDYFEKKGGFTPTLRGATVAGGFTYGLQTGRYLRLADRYLWSVVLRITGHDGAATGALQIAGMPFVAINNAAAGSGISTGYFTGLAAASNIVGISGIHSQNTSHVTLYKNVSTGGASQSLALADIGQTFEIRASGFCELP